jgi:2-dehydro-3-deoxy-D-arabinonate dehydratase
MALWQVLAGGERRLARGPAGQGPQELLPASVTIDALLGGPPGALGAALDGPSAGPVPAGARVVAPVGGQEVWAAGVTYTRSRDARVAESGTPDPYERVYAAERPELFFKAARAGQGQRPWSSHAPFGGDVPEPELAVVAKARERRSSVPERGGMLAQHRGRTSPPLGQIYPAAAIGPCQPPGHDCRTQTPADQPAGCPRQRQGEVPSTAVGWKLHSPGELVAAVPLAGFPVGVVLLTGTTTVPAKLHPARGRQIDHHGRAAGELRNVVEVIGPPRPAGGG